MFYKTHTKKAVYILGETLEDQIVKINMISGLRVFGSTYGTADGSSKRSLR